MIQHKRLPPASLVLDEYVPPSVSPTWEIHCHRPETILLQPSQLALHRVPTSPYGHFGAGMEDMLEGVHVLNAAALDCLLDFPHLIPETWKETTNGKITHIFFWGTIYYGPRERRLFVRNLYWYKGQWIGAWMAYDYCFHEEHPAAILRAEC